MKRFIMRHTGETFEAMYETRNAEKTKTKKYIYILYRLSISCRARIHRSLYSVIALPFCPNSRNEKHAVIPNEFSQRNN